MVTEMVIRCLHVQPMKIGIRKLNVPSCTKAEINGIKNG